MVKQLVYNSDTQWMGYDDSETFSLKKSWADGLCLGGSVTWSTDLKFVYVDDDTAAGVEPGDSGNGEGNELQIFKLPSVNGRCGAAVGNITCTGTTFGECCSIADWCGDTDVHCQVANGCQGEWGICWGNATTVSVDGRCGEVGGDGAGETCTGSAFGGCCSQYGYCGNGTEYCSVSGGCQGLFGVCTSVVLI